MGGSCDICDIVNASDTLENEVIEEEVVKAKIETEKRMYL